MIDLVHLHALQVIDEELRVVRIGAGARWGEVAAVLEDRGWAISAGDTTSVGVGGLALGGGIGWLVRKTGLTIDHLVAAEIVTADGSILRVSKDNHSDLFWALRGGGGNFGIVTAFDIAATPLPEVYAGTITCNPDDLPNLLRGWRDVMRAAPDKLTTIFMSMPGFDGRPPAIIILCCYAGADKEAAEAAIAPLSQLGQPPNQQISKKRYADVLEEAHMSRDVRVMVHNMFVDELSDELIGVIAKQQGMMLQIRSLGGAFGRVPVEATAFAHRKREALIVAPTFVPAEASPETIECALAPWREIAPYGNGAYSNFLSEVTPDVIKEIYPTETYGRLQAIKHRYDPENIFNQNFNIRPLA